MERGAARQSALRRLARRLFSGSTELLLTHLVAERDLSPELLRRVRRLLDDRLEG